MAVLQIHSELDANKVYEMLVAEGQVLTLVGYFLDSFYKRGKAENVKIPGAKVPPIYPSISVDNCDKDVSVNLAFLGQLCADSNIPDHGVAGRSLIQRTFLVAPYISADGKKEVKFSGNDNFLPNDDSLGTVMDAFTHHAFVDSSETFLPADLQGWHRFPARYSGLYSFQFLRIYFSERLPCSD